MKWAAALSREPSFDDAVNECAGLVRHRLGDGSVTLAFVFVTPHFADHYHHIYQAVRHALKMETFLGCSAAGVIGAGEEVERTPAISLVAARLPDVSVHPFHILQEDLPDLDGPPGDWERLFGYSSESEPQFILLSDPFSANPEAVITGLDYAYPASAKVGGMASGASSPGSNALFINDKVFSEGTIGVALSGDIAVDTIVAQGCRPAGPMMQITRADQNLLYELDGRPSFEVLRDLFSSLDGRDRELAMNALFLGVLMDEFDENPQVGDFLIRNVLGADPRRGALVVGERLQEGMRVRFHVRDARTSAEDLHAMLTGYEKTLSNELTSISGSLLFSCLGRGEHLYGTPNFDSGVFEEHLGEIPVGGFFCNGEIGPVGGTTFLHGYTSAFGIFRPRNLRS